MAKKDLLDVIPIPKMQVHPMPGELAPQHGALKYQQEIIDFFQPRVGKFPIFDLIFLGIGTDGHTASLFPGQIALHEKEKLVVAVKGGKPDVSRLTMTLPILNSARHLVFMVSGKEKASVVKTALEQSQVKLPAQRIHPLNGTISWLLDRDAASLLEEGTARERY
jgi:6-phosphogluconolactonase